MTPPTPEKAFTDEDLERLKEELARDGVITLDTDDGDGIIARLEASERKNKADDAYADFDCPHVSENQCKCGMVQIELIRECEKADNAWKSAAGK